MKNINNYKKVLVVLSVVISFFVTPIFLFAASFNNDPQDYQTLRIGNYTDNPNSTSDSWGVTVNADAGEIINLAIYYHNTSNETANNVRIRLTPQTTGVNISHTFTAYIWADNAPQISGSATVNLSSSQSITYKANSVVWRPNQTVWGKQSLLNGQNGSEIFSSTGLYLGNIMPGWSTQGNVMVSFLVGSASMSELPRQTPTITTNSATFISSNYANLNGSVNPNGSITAAWFEYGTNPSSLNNVISSQSVGSGNSSINYSSYINYLTANTTYYYRAVAQNSYGITYGNIMSFTTSNSVSGGVPTVYTNPATNISKNYAVFNGSVNPNNSNTTVWFEYGISSSFGYSVGSQSVGSDNSSTNFNATVSNLSSNTTYYYRAVAQNQYGTVYGNSFSFTTSGSSSTTSGSSSLVIGNIPSVITNPATFVYQNSALLNGAVNPNYGLTEVWFEYGLTASLGSITTRQPFGSGHSFYNYSNALTGLTSNTTYYYRAVAQNQYGTVYGNILSFKTQAPFYVDTSLNEPKYQPITIVQKISSGANIEEQASLIPSIIGELRTGQEITYKVIYKNLTKNQFNDVVLKIILPKEIKYQSSNYRRVILEDNNVIFNLDKIDAQSQGSISIKAQISDSVKTNDELIFGSILSYYDHKKIFQSVSAYLSASIFDFNKNRGLGFVLTADVFNIAKLVFGKWLIFFIIGLIGGFIIYYFFFKDKKEKSKNSKQMGKYS